MIEGLKFNVSGARLQTILSERLGALEEREKHYAKLLERMKDDDAEYGSPRKATQEKVERLRKAIEWVKMLSEFIEPTQTYMLTESELKSATNQGDYRRG